MSNGLNSRIYPIVSFSLLSSFLQGHETLSGSVNEIMFLSHVQSPMKNLLAEYILNVVTNDTKRLKQCPLLFLYARLLILLYVWWLTYLLFCINAVSYFFFMNSLLQNRLLAMNYIDEGHDDKLFEAHRCHIIWINGACFPPSPFHPFF